MLSSKEKNEAEKKEDRDRERERNEDVHKCCGENCPVATRAWGARGSMKLERPAAPENPQRPCACQRWLGDSGRRMKHALCPSRPCPRSLLFAELLQAPVIPGKRSADNLCRRRTRRWPAERSAGRSRKPGAGRPARDDDARSGWCGTQSRRRGGATGAGGRGRSTRRSLLPAALPENGGRPASWMRTLVPRFLCVSVLFPAPSWVCRSLSE